MTDRRIPDDVGETTQLSNAWRLRLAHSEDLRFVPGIGWVCWDGNRWSPDEALARQLCERVTRDLYAEAEDAFRACSSTQKRVNSDKDANGHAKDAAKDAVGVAAARLAHARRSQSVSSFRDMLAHAETFPEMRVQPDEVDAKPYLLACPNGTLDFETDRLRPPDRADLLTLASPVKYDPDADTSSWVAFLSDALHGDEEAVDYLRQFAGYCLCGEASQELFLLIYGAPGNGKSTFVESIAKCLGPELTITIDFETLCKRSTSTQKYDTARMRGRRLVRTSESDRNQRLDEGLICRWVGGEMVRGRAMYEDPFDFMPAFKLAVSVNGRPRINPDKTETGIWRRMVCVPFLRPTIDESIVDAGVKRYWTDPLGGGPVVLRWAASGAVDYVRAGRLPSLPAMFKVARESYRQECDVVHQFMSEHITVDRNGAVRREELRKHFVQWCQEQGDQYPPNAQQFNARVAGEPWRATPSRERTSEGHVHVWRGIRRLRPEDFDPKVCRVADETPCSAPIGVGRGPEDDEADRLERSGIEEHGS